MAYLAATGAAGSFLRGVSLRCIGILRRRLRRVLRVAARVLFELSQSNLEALDLCIPLLTTWASSALGHHRRLLEDALGTLYFYARADSTLSRF